MPLPRQAAAHTGNTSALVFYLWLAYTLLLVYGTLFPLQDWDWSAGGLGAFVLLEWPRYFGTGDLIVNVLVFMPFGFLIARMLWTRLGAIGSVLVATLLGTMLSAAVEYVQMFLPSRVASHLDIVLNGSGALIGALVQAILRPDSRIGKHLLAWRELWFIPGRLADFGLLVLLLWALAQLSPLVPSLDLGSLHDGLRPLLQALQDPSLIQPARIAVYACNLLGLALLAQTIIQPGRRALVLFPAFAMAVLLLKVPVVSRSLSLEALAGLLIAIIAYVLFNRGSQLRIIRYAAIALLAGLVIEQLRPGAPSYSTLYAFNWIPFAGHISSLVGIADILGSIWPYLAFAFLAIALRPANWVTTALLGALLLFGLVLALEWAQQFIPGRSPDITDALIAVFAWSLPWTYRELNAAPEQGPAKRMNVGSAEQKTWRRRLFVAATLGLASIGAGLALVSQTTTDSPTSAQTEEEPLPEAAALPPADLPGFRTAHPRLPVPDAQDLQRLRAGGGTYLKRARRQARGGKGSIEGSILTAYLDPTAIDLEHLSKRLAKLKFRGRGHDQAKLVARAYDWLYPHWNDEQRRRVRDKLIKGGEYIIRVIRKQSLSPYNVYLYNSPLQGLIATAIAVYGDDPRGDAIMNFAYDQLINRTVPVWQQVMGENGGWHEGGEYVGLGIGRAVYEIPAWWKEATGVDLFEQVPGIAGFSDFLVHRMRPDGTDVRLGDVASLRRDSPARKPLALKYDHMGAYALRHKPRIPEPTAWPWGPLEEVDRFDRDAVTALPTDAWFDGIGLLTARSDWSADATYVTFRAGDNYWSHSHLDQGAFTVYKGGALAIDSGLYGPRYGDDHHMNYTYQSIAHNVVTVTDPDDTVPSEKNGEQRVIANDGGQRRIGSGWGDESAPMDLREWMDKQVIYRTASMLRLVRDPDVIIAVADLTRAYTNELSGTGTFAHRTRRVERYLRTFAYDRAADVVLVYDQVESTSPQFRKRWLLHSLEQPQRTPDGFMVEVTGRDSRGHAGGRLQAHVVLPAEHRIDIVGGAGAEFLVDGVNYDQDGKVQAVAAKKKGREPGAWRVELSPAAAATTDRFLVALVPSLAGSVSGSDIDIRILDDGDRRGVEVRRGEHRSLWWTLADRGGLQVEINDRRLDATADLPPAIPIPEPPGWLERLLGAIRLSGD